MWVKNKNSRWFLWLNFEILAVDEIHTQFPSNLALYQFNDDINLPVFNESKDLHTLMSQTPREPPPEDKIKKPGHHDELLYIYTSGTTGYFTTFKYIDNDLMIMNFQSPQSCRYHSFPLYLHRCGHPQSRQFLGQRCFLQSTSTLPHRSRLHVRRSNAYFRVNCRHPQKVLRFSFLLRLL